MHVRSALVSCALLVCGCSKPEAEKKPIKLDLAFAEPEAGAAAPAVAADDAPAAYLALARAALDAATKLASKCDINQYGTRKAARFTDSCAIWKVADVEVLQKARAALEASPLAPDAGLAVGFVRRLRFFEQWASGFEKSALGYWPRAPGTLLYYQQLAMAWNAWQPKSPVPVDVQLKGYGRRIDAGASGHLEWGRCSEGPCIIQDRDDWD